MDFTFYFDITLTFDFILRQKFETATIRFSCFLFGTVFNYFYINNNKFAFSEPKSNYNLNT